MKTWRDMSYKDTPDKVDTLSWESFYKKIKNNKKNNFIKKMKKKDQKQEPRHGYQGTIGVLDHDTPCHNQE